MGVKGLWKLLSPVEKRVSLRHYALEEGFTQNVGGDRALRLGVDASGWFYRSCYRHSSTKNPELATLYARCNRLLQLPIVPLFVFDGPGRPNSKRGKNVRGNSHWIESDFKEMLDGFGFAWVEAPGEAEAELAHLSKQDFLDAVLTEDGDSFIFGTTTVMRIDETVASDKQVVVYKAEDIRDHPGLFLSTMDLVLIALLAGGDYDGGIKGCGIDIAFGLARGGMGRVLQDGIEMYHDADICLQTYLKVWRDRLVDETRTNRSSWLPHRCPAVANNIPEVFPPLHIVDLYIKPLVSNNGTPPPCLFGKSLSPRRLAQFAENHFSWNNKMDILEHFSDTIFPGLALRQTLEVARAQDVGLKRKATFLGPVACKSTAGICACHPGARVKLRIPVEVVHSIVDGLDGHLRSHSKKDDLERWISVSLPRLRGSVPTDIIQTIGHR